MTDREQEQWLSAEDIARDIRRTRHILESRGIASDDAGLEAWLRTHFSVDMDRDDEGIETLTLDDTEAALSPSNSTIISYPVVRRLSTLAFLVERLSSETDEDAWAS